jgi:hypothetical protein
VEVQSSAADLKFLQRLPQIGLVSTGTLTRALPVKVGETLSSSRPWGRPVRSTWRATGRCQAANRSPNWRAQESFQSVGINLRLTAGLSDEGILGTRFQHHICAPPGLVVDQTPFVAFAEIVLGE